MASTPQKGELFPHVLYCEGWLGEDLVQKQAEVSWHRLEGLESLAAAEDYAIKWGNGFRVVVKELLRNSRGRMDSAELKELCSSNGAGETPTSGTVEQWIEALVSCNAVMTFEHSPDEELRRTVLLHPNRRRNVGLRRCNFLLCFHFHGFLSRSHPNLLPLRA